MKTTLDTISNPKNIMIVTVNGVLKAIHACNDLGTAMKEFIALESIHRSTTVNGCLKVAYMGDCGNTTLTVMKKDGVEYSARVD
jgi:hypothetical protein